MKLDPESILTGADADAWHDFARDLRMKGCSPRTLETYGESLAQLATWLPGTPDCPACFGTGGVHAGKAAEERCELCPPGLLAATRADLTGYLTWVRETHRGACARSGARRQACRGHAGTQSVRYRALRRFWRWLAAEEICGNAMEHVPAPLPVHKAPGPLTDDDLRALLKACEGKDFEALRDTAIIQLWCEVGCPRASEVAGLLEASVDLGRDLVTVAGKGRKERVIVLSPATARAFARYRRARGRRPDAGRPEFFLGLKGPMTRSGMGQMLARRSAAAGLGRIHPHQLRHASSVAARRAGLPDTVIAHLNGWTSTRMLEVYGRAQAAAEAVEIARAAGLGGRLARAAR